MHLPEFRYHPDSVASGSVVPSDTECVCCAQVRGYIYVGPVYSVQELDSCICPWYIADGSAHLRFNADFTDPSGVGGYSLTETLPESVVAEVAYRTPGFSGWQQEHWLACCNDAAEFLGPAGYRELQSVWPEAVAAVQADSGLSGSEWSEFFRCLSRDGGPTAYVFRCRHCRAYLAYQDCH